MYIYCNINDDGTSRELLNINLTFYALLFNIGKTEANINKKKILLKMVINVHTV